MDELAGHGAIRAVFEDLGGYGALASQQGEGGEGPLVGHLQRTNIQLAAIGVFVAMWLILRRGATPAFPGTADTSAPPAEPSGE